MLNRIKNMKLWKKVILVIVLLGVVFGESSNNKTEVSNSELGEVVESATEQAEPEEVGEEVEDVEEIDIREMFDTDTTYEDLIRYPDKYHSSMVNYNATVLQLVKESKNEYHLLVKVYDNIDNIAYVTVPTHLVDGRLLEGDQIRLYAYSWGLRKYTTAFGVKKEVPFLHCEYADRR